MFIGENETFFFKEIILLTQITLIIFIDILLFIWKLIYHVSKKLFENTYYYIWFISKMYTNVYKILLIF